MRLKKSEKIGYACAGVAAVAFAIWWPLHDPFHAINGHITYDQTTLYLPAEPLYHTPRRFRVVYFKDLSMQQLVDSIKNKYAANGGWQWHLDRMPKGFIAFRRSPGDRQPEQVSGVHTSENTIELVEVRVMSPEEVQFVKRTQGSEAFISDPDAPRERPPVGNPRFALAP